MLIPEIPREIADLIVAELVTNGTNLPPLLVLSRVFRAAIRDVIFRDILVVVGRTTNSWEKTCTNGSLLLKAIQADLDIVQSMRHLSLRFIFHTEEEHKERRKGGWEGDWTSALATIFPLLLAGPITTLTIEDPKVMSRFDFSRLDAVSLQGLIALRSLPSMTTLVFRRLKAIPLDLLRGSQPNNDRVQSVVMSNVTIAATTRDLVDSSTYMDSDTLHSGNFEAPFPPNLTRLEITCPYDLFKTSPGTQRIGDGKVNYSNIPHFHQLNTLIVEDMGDDPKGIEAMARVIANTPTIETLSLGYVFSVGGAVYVDKSEDLKSLLQALQQARQLHSLDFVCTRTTITVPHAMQSMIHFLLQISDTPDFRIQHIKATFRWINMFIEPIRYLIGVFDKLVDEVLNKHTSLESFTLVIYYSPIARDDVSTQALDLAIAKAVIEKSCERTRKGVSFTYEFIKTELRY